MFLDFFSQKSEIHGMCTSLRKKSMSKKLGLRLRTHDVIEHLHCGFNTRHLLDAKESFSFLFTQFASTHLRRVHSEVKHSLEHLAFVERTLGIRHKIEGHAAGFEHQTLSTTATT